MSEMARHIRLSLRRATLVDGERLLAWVNRPDSLAGKLRTTAPIPRDTHLRWLAARLNDPDCRIHIIEQAGMPVGQLRLERIGAGYEIDIYLEPDARGRGLAAQAIRIAIAERCRADPDCPIVARVKSDNAESRRLFEAIGFALEPSTADHLLYRYPGQTS